VTTAEPELTIAWLTQALGIVRQISEMNGYNPPTLAALHWGEKAVQRIADLTVERDWLLAEASDDVRARYFAAKRDEASATHPTKTSRSGTAYSVTVCSDYPSQGSMTVGALRDFVRALDAAEIPDSATLTAEHNHSTSHFTALRVQHTVVVKSEPTGSTA
jgi:murein tripeptide amidase MpaA